MTEAESCSICGASRPPLWSGGVWKQCAGCRTLLRHPMPTESELRTLYEQSWATPQQCRSETGGTDVRLARLYVRRLCESIDRSDLNGLRVLDFGAGRGEMLSALQEAGAQVVAVEPFGWQLLRDQGFEAYQSVEALPDALRVDGVISLDVVEHLLTPWQPLEALRRHLKPGGWMCICTPNGQSLRARLRREQWGECGRDGHLMLFGPAGMEHLFERAGFKQYNRLKWYIPFSTNPLRNVSHYALHALGADGELRYMAWA